ncbi:MAG: hypothetical protein AAB904_01825, partial [Patescibacteria group bacterium]
MKKKKLRRRIMWGAFLLLLASTPFWVNFPTLFAKLGVGLSSERAQKALPPPPAAKPAKTDVSAKVNEFLRKEGDLLPGAKAEIVGIIDLNGDGVWEIVANAEAGGAYTTLFAVTEYKGGNVSYLNLIDREGEAKRARFIDGSSVRHANAFKIFSDERRGKAYVQLTGESDDTGKKWTWDVAAYSWN